MVRTPGRHREMDVRVVPAPLTSKRISIAMDRPTVEELVGLTLEEAVHHLIPRGWLVVVHRYDENEYENAAPKEPTISLTDGDEVPRAGCSFL